LERDPRGLNHAEVSAYILISGGCRRRLPKPSAIITEPETGTYRRRSAKAARVGVYFATAPRSCCCIPDQALVLKELRELAQPIIQMDEAQLTEFCCP